MPARGSSLSPKPHRPPQEGLVLSQHETLLLPFLRSIPTITLSHNRSKRKHSKQSKLPFPAEADATSAEPPNLIRTLPALLSPSPSTPSRLNPPAIPATHRYAVAV